MSVLVVVISLILVTVTSCFEVVAPVIKTVGKSHVSLFYISYFIKQLSLFINTLFSLRNFT